MTRAAIGIRIDLESNGAMEGLRQVRQSIDETGKAAERARGNFAGMKKALAEVSAAGAPLQAVAAAIKAFAPPQLSNALEKTGEDLGKAFSEETESAVRAMTAALQENEEGLRKVYKVAAKIVALPLNAIFGTAEEIVGDSVLEKFRAGGSLDGESAKRLSFAQTNLVKRIRELEERGSRLKFEDAELKDLKEELPKIQAAFKAADGKEAAAAARASADRRGEEQAADAAAARKRRAEEEEARQKDFAKAQEEAAKNLLAVEQEILRAREKLEGDPVAAAKRQRKKEFDERAVKIKAAFAAEKLTAKQRDEWLADNLKLFNRQIAAIDEAETQRRKDEAEKRAQNEAAAAKKKHDEEIRLKMEAANKAFADGNIEREFNRRRGALLHGEETANAIYNYEQAVAHAEHNVATEQWDRQTGDEAKELARLEYQAFLDEMTASTDEATETMAEAWARIVGFDFNNTSAELTEMGRSFIQAGAGAIVGGKSISAAFRQMGAAVAQRVAAAATEFAIVAALDLAASPFIGPGKILNHYYGTSAFSRGGGNSGKTANTPDGYEGGKVSVFHAGGVVGAGSAPTRRVAAGVFAAAPRLHGGGVVAGLRADERPAILQTGEGVLSRRDMRALAKSKGGNIKVNIINNTGAPAEASASEREDEAGGRVVDIILTSIGEGAVGQRLEGQYGLRRQPQ